jgi:hypothetical protein
MVPARAVLKLEIGEGFRSAFPDVQNNKFIEYAIGRSVEQIIDTGYWANGPTPGSFVFVDGVTGQMMPDPENPTAPYTMTKTDIERMGRNSRAAGRPNDRPAEFSTFTPMEGN